MMPSQAQSDLFVGDDPGQYLDSSKWGFFSILARDRNKRQANQRSYPLRDLPDVIHLISKSSTDYDYWISQAAFKTRNRRKINLAHVGTCFVDLDYYTRPELKGLSPQWVTELMLASCDSQNIPYPSLVVYSGQGLQAKWFHEALPSRALPRWDRVQQELVSRFQWAGADPNARDASRVLRLVDTVNQKTRRRCKIIYMNTRPLSTEPQRYCFNDLADQLLPLTSEQLRQLRIEQSNNKKLRKVLGPADIKPYRTPARNFTLDSLNWNRLNDIRKLKELRGGDVGDGMREPCAFWLANFYCLRYYSDLATRPLDDWLEIREAFKYFGPHWGDSIVRQKASTLFTKVKQAAAGEMVTWNNKEYTPLYTPSNATLIERLQITPAEEKTLTTIISEGEKRRRKKEKEQEESYKQEHRERNRRRRKGRGAVSRKDYEEQRQQGKQEKINQAHKLRTEGLTIKQVAERMSVSLRSVKSYLKEKVQLCVRS